MYPSIHPIAYIYTDVKKYIKSKRIVSFFSHLYTTPLYTVCVCAPPLRILSWSRQLHPKSRQLHPMLQILGFMITQISKMSVT